MNTPVLFLVFNRPDTTTRVLNAIRKAAPKRLYVAADGGRPDHPSDNLLVRQVRESVASAIDWDCDLQTLFRDHNMGCKMAVSSAIDWFFSHEKQGIILEDDCLPDQSFFTFCEELLSRYADNQRVWHIGGNNYQDGITRGDGDYYFSRHNHIWGWATWRDRWLHYDPDMNGIDDFLRSGRLNDILANKGNRKIWHKFFNWISKGLDTWDIQWQYIVWKHDGLSIIPNQNLVSNIGFGEGATHTPEKDSPLANRETASLVIHQHPARVEPDMKADEYEYLAYRKRPGLVVRLQYHTRKLFNNGIL